MKRLHEKIKKFVLPLLLLTGLCAATSINAFGQEKENKPNPKLAKQAKITLAEAREIAQKQTAGKIEGEELEREHGKLVYSFDIRNDKNTITEVQVDAKTGAIVSTEEETKEQEIKEKKADEKQAKKKGGKT